MKHRANPSPSSFAVFPVFRNRWTLLHSVLALLLLGGATSGFGQGTKEPLSTTVLRVVPGRVDLVVPRTGRLTLGSKLIVLRGGQVVAELEVTFASDRAVSCRVDREFQPITVGDDVREPPGGPSQPAPRAGAQAPAPVPGTSVSPAPDPSATTAKPILVRQVMASVVYLDGGLQSGLDSGQRAKVLRGGEEIAEIEVAFVSNHAASCRVLTTKVPIQAGDRIVPGPLPQGAPGRTANAGGAPGSKVPSPSGQTASGRSLPLSGMPAKPSRDPLSGSIALRYQGFQDGGSSGRSLGQAAALVNLNARQIGGGPYQVLVRGRTGQQRITRASGPVETRPDDRLYEASLSYEPPEGKISFQLGRLTAGPAVGFDYLDGLLGEARVTSRFGVGGFYGSRPSVDGLSLNRKGRAYGLFAHYLNQTSENPYSSEWVVGAIGEYKSGVVDREYLSLYGRQGSGSRWTLYENAELDVNRLWRRTTGTAPAYQVSNLLVSGTVTATKALRFGVTYDQRRRYRTLDDRETPEFLFDNALREGIQASAYLGLPTGVRANLSAGLRRKADSSEKFQTYNASLYHSNLMQWNLQVGSDYSAFSGDTSKGSRMGFRIQKYFGSGHDLELTVGRSTTEILATREQRRNRWIRLSATAQLGRRYFLLGEYEVTRGDDLEGARLFLELGYRL